MEILIDASSCPGSIIKICRDSGKPVKIIRERPSDLYQESSGDYEQELLAEKQKADEIVKNAGKADILVTRDLDMARKVNGRVLAVLHPNGFVYNSKSIMLLSYEKFIAEQNRAAGQKSSDRIKSRNPGYDQNFEQTLYGFIGRI
ncbi:MAG: DUF188 domain-containing protein [Eubacteriaceae bacterium]|jgi:uncharacterized protein YaiI (UPF0178 family)